MTTDLPGWQLTPLSPGVAPAPTKKSEATSGAAFLVGAGAPRLLRITNIGRRTRIELDDDHKLGI